MQALAIYRSRCVFTLKQILQEFLYTTWKEPSLPCSNCIIIAPQSDRLDTALTTCSVTKQVSKTTNVLISSETTNTAKLICTSPHYVDVEIMTTLDLSVMLKFT